MPKTAYLAFYAEPPIIGLDPHPAYAPEEQIQTFDAEGYARALGAHENRAELEAIVMEDHEGTLEAVDDGDLADADEPDEIYEVTFHDDGRIEVIHDNPRYVIAEFTIADVYGAYGMKMPSQPQQRTADNPGES